MADPKEKSRRQKAADKIKALWAKTIENGCTEGEALAAAELAAKLMAQNDLTEDEVNLSEDGFARKEKPVVDVVELHLWKVARAVATLCEVRDWTVGSGRDIRAIVFFGLAPDVEIAEYLLAIAERAMRGAYAGHEVGTRLLREHVRRRRAADFVDGMADRLAEKIREIAWTRRAAKGKGLVVAKEKIVGQELERLGINFKSGRDRYSREGTRDYANGRDAVEDVRFDASVSAGARPVAAIGTMGSASMEAAE